MWKIIVNICLVLISFVGSFIAYIAIFGTIFSGGSTDTVSSLNAGLYAFPLSLLLSLATSIYVIKLYKNSNTLNISSPKTRYKIYVLLILIGLIVYLVGVRL